MPKGPRAQHSHNKDKQVKPKKSAPVGYVPLSRRIKPLHGKFDPKNTLTLLGLNFRGR
jgi:hypothetical protein